MFKKKSIQASSVIFFVIINFFFSLTVFAQVPPTPFTPSQNITDPVASYPGCAPTVANCYVDFSQYSNSTTTTLNILNATTSNLLNASITNSTSTNLFSQFASFTNSTSTNLFTSILNALTATINNLVATNSTTTGIFSLIGAFKDATGATGTPGQILSSTGTSTIWINNNASSNSSTTTINNLYASTSFASSTYISNFLSIGTTSTSSIFNNSLLTIVGSSSSSTINLLSLFNASGTQLISFGPNGGLTIASITPATTTNTIYNLGGVLYWNGSTIGGSSLISNSTTTIGGAVTNLYSSTTNIVSQSTTTLSAPVTNILSTTTNITSSGTTTITSSVNNFNATTTNITSLGTTTLTSNVNNLFASTTNITSTGTTTLTSNVLYINASSTTITGTTTLSSLVVGNLTGLLQANAGIVTSLATGTLTISAGAANVATSGPGFLAGGNLNITIGTGNFTAPSNPEFTITGGTNSVLGAGIQITIPDANNSTRGLVTTGAQNFSGTKTFVSGFTSSATSSLSAVLNMNSNFIQNLATPVNSNDAVNKSYVDAAVAAGVATTSVISLATGTPPGILSIGDRYLLQAGNSGFSLCVTNNIAQWTGFSWSCNVAATGTSVLVTNTGYTYQFNGSTWVQTSGAISVAQLTGKQGGDGSNYFFLGQTDYNNLTSGSAQLAQLLTTGAPTFNGLNITGTTTLNGIAYNWPATQASNTVLSTNGSGVLSWITALTANLATGNIFVGNGAGQASAVTMSGDATIASGGALTLANSGVVAGTYGTTTSTQIPIITVDSKGRITSISTTSVLVSANASITSATTTYSTTTYLFSNNASISNATTTNFFTAVLSALSSYFTNLGFASATGTNLAVQNFIATGTAQVFNFFASTTYATTTNTNTLSFINATGSSLGIGGLVVASSSNLNGTTTLGGNLNANGNKILSVAVPTNSTDAANKAYVDALIQGLSWQNPVISFITVATTSSSTGDRYIVSTTSNIGMAPCDIYDICQNTGVGQWSAYSVATGTATGTSAFVQNLGTSYTWNGSNWASLGASFQHNSLIGIQGGNGSTEEYHLTLQQWTDLTSSGAQLAQLKATGTPTFGALTVTGNATFTTATFTNSTSTNFFTNIFNAVLATITNLIFTNATGTNIQLANASTTNFSATGTTQLATTTISSLLSMLKQTFAGTDVGGAIVLQSATSSWAATSSALYNNNGTLYWNGSAVGVGGATSSATSSGSIGNIQFATGNGYFTSSSTLTIATTTGSSSIMVGINTSSPNAALTVVGNYSQLLTSESPVRTVSTLTGFNVYGAEVVGRYAYVVSNFSPSSLSVVDVSNPTSPVVVASTTVSTPSAMLMHGKYAYVISNLSSGIQSIDVTNPYAPVVVGSTTVSTTPYTSMGQYGNYIYFGGGGAINTINVVDISNPRNMVQVANPTLSTTYFNMDIQGNYLYTSNTNDTISIYSLANPLSPVLLGTTATFGGTQALYALRANGKFVYTMGLNTGKFFTVDVSNPTAPVIVGQINSAILGSPQYKFGIMGRYILASGNGNKLAVIDVSSSTAPSIASLPSVLGLSPVTVFGKYVITSGGGSMAITDLTGMEVTSLTAGAIETSQLSVRNDVTVNGNITTAGTLFAGAGGIFSDGVLYVAASSSPSYFGGGIKLATTSTASTTMALYNVNGTLFWNGSALGTAGLPASTTSLYVGANGGVGIGATTSVYGGSALQQGLTLGYTTTGGQNITNSLAIASATSSSLVSSIARSLYNVNDVLYWNGSAVSLSGINNNGVSAATASGTSQSVWAGVGSDPWDVAVDSSGNIFVAVRGANRVDKITSAGVVTTSFGLAGTQPQNIAVDSQGNVYTADITSNTVSKISSTGGFVTNYGTGGTPTGIVIDKQDNIYTSNSAANTVTKITSTGVVTTAWATVGSSPSDVAVDSQGNVYTANSTSGSISKITPSGVVTTTWASVTLNPYRLAIDSNDNVYVARSGTSNIAKITPAGVVTLAWATVGTSPNGIAIDAANNLYVTNQGDNTISKITSAGVSTLWATTDVSPRGIAIDKSGNVYTANSGTSNSVSKISTAATTQLNVVSPLSVNSTATFNNALILASTTVSTTTFALYNNNGALYWNGSAVGVGLPASTTSLYVNMNGTVGIGTTSSSKTLAVAGSILNYISTSSQISQVGVIATSTSLLTSPRGMVVGDSYLYVANSGNSNVGIIDISNPSTPITLTNINGGAFPYELALAGHYLYVANFGGNTFSIHDVNRNTSFPGGLGSIVTQGPRGVAVSGKYAYVTNYTLGRLSVFDVSSTTRILSVASTTVGGNPGNLVIDGQYVYVANQASSTVSVVDINNPLNPVQVASTSVGTLPVGIAISGRYLYVANQNSNTVSIVDITNPLALTQVATVAVDASPYGIAVAGKYAYTVSQTANTMTMIDISSSTAPFVVAKTAVGNTPRGIVIKGHYAYVSNAGDNTVSAVDLGGLDVSNVTAGSVDAGKLYVTGDIFSRGSISTGNSLFVGYGGILSGGGISIISTTTASTFAGSLAVGTSTNIYGGALTQGITLNNALVLASSTAISTTTMALYNNNGILYWNGNALASGINQTNTGIFLIGTSSNSIATTTSSAIISNGLTIAYNGNNANSLSGNGQYASMKVMGTSTTGVAGNTNILANGKYAYVTSSTGDSFSVFDIQNPNNPVFLNSLVDSTNIPFAFGLAQAGKYVLVNSSSTQVLIDPNIGGTPRILSQISSTTAEFNQSIVKGNYGYTCGYSDFTVTDLTNSQSISVVGQLDTPTFSNCYGFDIGGDYAYVLGASSNAVGIINISNPRTPYLAGLVSSTTAFNVGALKVSGKYMYVVDGFDNKFTVWDLTNPTSPTVVSIMNNPTGGTLTNKMEIYGNYAMVNSTQGYRIIDISNPLSPQVVGGVTTYSTFGFSNGYSISGRYLYTISSSAPFNMWVWDLGGIDTPSVSAGSVAANLLNVSGISRLADLFSTSLNVAGNAMMQGSLSLSGYASSTNGTATTTLNAALYIASSTPATTNNALYQQGGTLYWNGSAIAGSGTGYGQSDYIRVYMSTTTNNGQESIANNGTVNFENIDTQIGNVSYSSSTGRFTLIGGRTYEIQTNIMSANASAYFNWQDIYLGNSVIASTTLAQNENGSFSFNYTPTTTRTIALYNVSGGARFLTGVRNSFGVGSQVIIRQLGAQAINSLSFNMIGSATTTNTLDNTNFDQTWNWSTATSGNALTLNAAALTTGTLLTLNSQGSSTALEVNGSASFSSGFSIASGTPATTTYALYNNNGVLFWNGSQLSGGLISSSTSLYESLNGGVAVGTTTNIYGGSLTAGLTMNNALVLASSTNISTTTFALYNNNSTLYWNNNEVMMTNASWYGTTVPTTEQWDSVNYLNGRFLATAFNNSFNGVMTSTNGVTWTSASTPGGAKYRSSAYGNNTYVIVAQDNFPSQIETSPDTITWTDRTAPANHSWYSVAYGAGLFVAVGSDASTGNIMTSPDGITWTSRTKGDVSNLYSVIYAGGQFVAVGATNVFTSPDGITWTTRTPATAQQWNSVTYGNGLYVAVTSFGTTANQIMTSPDGITWTSRTSPNDSDWIGVTYGKGVFVAVGQTGDYSQRIMVSSDGISWSLRTAPSTNTWQGVAYGNGIFAAVSSNGTQRAMYSQGVNNFAGTTGNISSGTAITIGSLDSGSLSFITSGVVREFIDSVTGGVGNGTTTNIYGGSLTKGLTLNNALVLASSTAISTTTFALYNNNGALYWNTFALLQASSTSLNVGLNGRVAIGTTTATSSTDMLRVAGDVEIGTTGTSGCLRGAGGNILTGTCSSDQNLKQNITSIGTTLDRFANLDFVTFNWNDFAHSLLGNSTTATNTGVIAQQVESQFPELVSTSSLGFKQVDFTTLQFYAYKAIQDLNKKVFGTAPTAQLTIEEITASTTIPLDEKLKALGTNVKEVNDILAQFASTTSATTTSTTTEMVTISTTTSTIYLNASGTPCTFDANLCNIATTTITYNYSTSTVSTTTPTFLGMFLNRISNWLADTTNGITKIFAGEVRAKDKICVGETCLTEDQLKDLMKNANINQTQTQSPSAPTTAPQSPTEPTTTPNQPTGEQPVTSGGTTATDPEPVQNTTPDPAPAPTGDPAPAPAPSAPTE